jgi:KUP system potassium uptake protein
MPTTVAAAAGSLATQRSSRSAFWALTLGSIGVVYGDIGTSPLYAFREAINAAVAGSDGAVLREPVLGVLSLILWALIVIVTLQIRADSAARR